MADSTTSLSPTRTLSAVQSLTTASRITTSTSIRATMTTARSLTSTFGASYTSSRYVSTSDEYESRQAREDREFKAIVSSVIIGSFLMIGLSCWGCFYFSARGRRKRAQRRAERKRHRLGLAPLDTSAIRGPYMVERGSAVSIHTTRPAPNDDDENDPAAIVALGRPDPNACLRCLDRFVSAPVGAPGESGRAFGCTCSPSGAGGRYFESDATRRPIILRDNSDDTVRDLDLDSDFESESDTSLDLERGMGIVHYNGIYGRPVDIDNPRIAQTSGGGAGTGTGEDALPGEWVDEIEAAYRAEIVAAQAALDALRVTTSADGQEAGRGGAGPAATDHTRSPRDIELQEQITALRTRMVDRRAQLDRQERRRRRAVARARSRDQAGGSDEHIMDWGPLNHLVRSPSGPSGSTTHSAARLREALRYQRSSRPHHHPRQSQDRNSSEGQTIYRNPRDPEGGVEDAAPAYVQEAREREVVIDAAEPEGPPEYRAKEEEEGGEASTGSGR